MGSKEINGFGINKKLSPKRSKNETLAKDIMMKKELYDEISKIITNKNKVAKISDQEILKIAKLLGAKNKKKLNIKDIDLGFSKPKDLPSKKQNKDIDPEFSSPKDLPSANKLTKHNKPKPL